MKTPFTRRFSIVPTELIPILMTVETPDFFELDPGPPTPAPDPYSRPAPAGGLWSAGDRITWISALVLMLSAFMGWYSGSGVGVTLSVIGWHTGTLGKLVFFVGLAIIAVVVLRE